MLRGFEHATLENISCIAEGPAAIAISRGGAKKTYHHRDPNEDACGFAWSQHGVLLVVADGHAGADAAQIAVERIIGHHAESLLAGAGSGVHGRWPDTSFGLALDIHEEILRRCEVVAEHPSRTTLSLAVARPEEDWLGWLNVGDSLVFRVEGGAAHTFPGPERVTYLGSPKDDRSRIQDAVAAGTTELGATDAIALATDGLSEQGIGVAVPAEAVQQAYETANAAKNPDLRPLGAARGLAEIANGAHREQRAGDNIATAVAWLAD
jgi:serine/threonine protein phosphatase PrpC